MKPLYLILIVVVFVGCSEEKGIEIMIPDECGVYTELRNEIAAIVMKAWAESEDGPISFDCVYEMYQYEIVCLEDIRSECKSSYGCFSVDDLSIYLPKNRNKLTNLETLGHEFIHIGQKCRDGVLDPNHASGVHWIKTGGDESIEGIVFDMIDKKYDDE